MAGGYCTMALINIRPWQIPMPGLSDRMEANNVQENIESSFDCGACIFDVFNSAVSLRPIASANH
jgi:hypothetical protein